MKNFSIKVGQKKFHVKQNGFLVTLRCETEVIRDRECETVELAERDYEVILDTLNDIGEHFD